MSGYQVSVQAVFWIVVAVLLAVLTVRPAIAPVGDGQSEIRFVIRASGKLLGECLEMTREQLGNLAPNMRAPVVCPREKSPLYAVLEVDGRIYFEETISASGLHDDGVLAAFERVRLDAGQKQLAVRVRDDQRVDGFTHELEKPIILTPERILFVHFDDEGLSVREG